MTQFKVRHELSSLDTLMTRYELRMTEACNGKIDIKWLQKILQAQEKKKWECDLQKLNTATGLIRGWGGIFQASLSLHVVATVVLGLLLAPSSNRLGGGGDRVTDTRHANKSVHYPFILTTLYLPRLLPHPAFPLSICCLCGNQMQFVSF